MNIVIHVISELDNMNMNSHHNTFNILILNPKYSSSASSSSSSSNDYLNNNNICTH
ncbi:unnamed protein product [Schistosoma mattheei]|uniref:Uncharacterized protein n=1 Tax=Schistosoma mattheei TaxID=31246 RepID=A0A183NEK3_9TREM|nr:unnamed protein product [Schistosoma mattheei]